MSLTLGAWRVMLVLVVGAIGLGAAGCDKHKQDKQDIHALWKEWDRVNVASDGPGAVKVYSAATHDYYGNLVKLGLTASSKDVWNLPPHQMLEILLMRHRASRKELEGLADGKAYVQFATGRGWYSDAESTMVIKDVKVMNDWATATMYDEELMKDYESQKSGNIFGGRRARILSGGSRGGGRMPRPPEYTVRFVKEADGWKLEESSIFPHTDQWITEAAKWNEQSVRDFLMSLEEEISGKEVAMTVWEPLKKETAKKPAGKK